MKRIQIYVTDEQYAMVEFQAAAKLISPSAYVALSVASYIDKYAVRGVMAEMVRRYGAGRQSPVYPTFLGSGGKIDVDTGPDVA